MKNFRYRIDYYKGCYYDLEIKEWSIGNPNITLKEALDCWWNSIRIEGNICYKNAYTCDPIYELDGLTKKDLKRKIWIFNRGEDSDGYPIAYAKFVE